MEFDFGSVAEGVGKVEIRNEKLEIRKQNVEEKMAARSRHYRNKEKRDSSLRRSTLSQERKRKKESVCSVRNDGARAAGQCRS